MAAFLFSPLAPCKLLCLVLGRVRKKEQFLAAVMLVVSGSGRISKLTFYSRFPSLVSLTFPTRTSRCCSNESGNSSPHGRLNLQRSGSQLQGSTLLLGQFILPGSAHGRGSWEMTPGHFLPARDPFGWPGQETSLLYCYLCKCTLLLRHFSFSLSHHLKPFPLVFFRLLLRTNSQYAPRDMPASPRKPSSP